LQLPGCLWVFDVFTVSKDTQAALGSSEANPPFPDGPYIPTTYKSPVDLADLGTMWLGYIPSDVVDVLAAEIKAKQSKFYMGVPGGIATDLVDRVNAGSNLRSVSDNGGTSGTSGSTVGGDGVTGATNADSKSRQDAIIGIVSVLGAIALLVLMFLVHRSMKRSGLVK